MRLTRRQKRNLRNIATPLVIALVAVWVAQLGGVAARTGTHHQRSAKLRSEAATQLQVRPLVCGGDTEYEVGSGARDSAGRTYVACSRNAQGTAAPHILVIAPNGTEAARIPLPSGGPKGISDVAPSPDGSMLYVIGADTKRVQRMVRSKGNWIFDPKWQLAKFNLLVPWDPLGTYLAVSGEGNIYLASGFGAPAPYTVVEYAPDGSFITRFGQAAKESWLPGDFYDALAGIAVSDDGSYVYTTETGNDRIQRFARKANGSYVADRSVGDMPRHDRSGSCGDLGKLSSPLDVATGPTGDVYAINTGCASQSDGTNFVEVQRFSADLTPQERLLAPTKTTKPVKGIAIDAAGHIVLPGAGIVAFNA